MEWRSNRSQAKQRIDVMLSSTSKDLELHREQAKEAVLRVGMFPQVMTSLVASVKDPIGVSMQLVDQSEVYVGIFAHRYGYIPEDEERNPNQLSMTELEYRRAVERGIPILIFIMKDSHAVEPQHYEVDVEKRGKLQKLKTKLKAKHTVSFFTTPEDLRAEMIPALYASELQDQAQYVAEDDKSIQNSRIPHPPNLYSMPPYIQTGDFIGREYELTLLDNWIESPDPVMIVNALGGQGKSALTWHWIQICNRHFDGMIWWSFYERGATMNAFLRHAIAYIEKDDPDDPKFQQMEYYERKNRLMMLLQSSPYLIILDGMERILTAYHRLDKAQLRDDQVKEDIDMRACIDPQDRDFLFQLAGIAKSKFLISTRLIPRIFQDYTGSPISGIQQLSLSGLSPVDAQKLLEHNHIRFTAQNTLHTFLKQFDYHSLLLKIVIGRIKQDRRARGDFDIWHQQHARTFDFTKMDIKQRRTTILQYAMHGLDDDAKILLSRIAAFNYGVSFEVLEFVANQDTNIKTFDRMLSELEDRGLLEWDRKTDVYNLHPVVRGFAFAELSHDDRVATYNRIYDHFNSQEFDLENVTSVEQLQIPMAIYQARIGAERYDEAVDFYYGAFSHSLFYGALAYPTIIQMLEPHFSDDLENIRNVSGKSRQSYVMNSLALVYQASGMSERSLKLLGQTFRIAIDLNAADNLIINIANFGNTAQEANNIHLQHSSYQIMLQFAELIGEYQGATLLHIFKAYNIQGNRRNSDITQARLIKLNHNDPFYAYEIAEIQFKLGRVSLQSFELLINQSVLANNTRTLMETYGLMILFYLRKELLSKAETYANEAILYARRSGSFMLARYLGRLALVYSKQDNFDQAMQFLNEAWRGTVVKFDEAELYNCAAELYRELGDNDTATENAINAYKVAWADGPPYSNWWQLKQAKAHLDALGVDYPDMPPFEESKVNKLPYEDEIREYLEELKRKKAKHDTQDND